VETAQLDCNTYCTPWSSSLIQMNTSSCLASCFYAISSEASFSATMMKLKSYEVRVLSNLVLVAFTFFWDGGFSGETFLLFEGSSSSLGGVTSPFFCSTFAPSISPPYHPCSAKMEEVFMDALSKSWTSSILFIFLGLGVSCVAYELSKSDISARSAGMRRSADQSLVISSKSSSIIL
jgi:hypothetical protein